MALVIAGLGMMQPVSSASSGDATTAADIKQETRELLRALKAYSVEQRDKAVEQARVALQNLDKRIETLEADMLARWDEMDQATRAKTQASLQALRQQRTRVAEWYGGMKSGSASAWAQIKQGFSSAYEELREAWESSEREIGSEGKK
jgi:NAD(P)H-dependent flavin oxidoreductase YrpB (nitropropane dioxygenase family)